MSDKDEILEPTDREKEVLSGYEFLDLLTPIHRAQAEEVILLAYRTGFQSAYAVIDAHQIGYSDAMENRTGWKEPQ